MELNLNDEGIENLTDIKRVTQILDKLSEILQAESNYIRDIDTVKLEEIQATKIPLMNWLNIFQNYVTLINPKFFEEVDEEWRENFFDSYKSFQDIVKQNYEALENAITINQHVAGLVHHDLKNSLATNVYSKKASLTKFSMAQREIETKFPVIVDMSA